MRERITYEGKRAVDDALKLAGTKGADGIYTYHPGRSDAAISEALKIDIGSVRYVRQALHGPLRRLSPPPAEEDDGSASVGGLQAQIIDLRGLTRVQAAEIRELRRLIDWMAEAWCGFSGNRAPEPASNGGPKQSGWGIV